MSGTALTARRRDRVLTGLAWLAVGLTLVDIVAAAINADVASIMSMLGFMAFPLVALVIARARPGHAVAWCFVVAALLSGLEKAGAELSTIGPRDGWPDGVTHAAAWAQSWPWFPGLFILITVALLRFPDGRLLTRRWRWVEWLAYASMGIWTVAVGTTAAFLPTAVLLSSDTPDPHGPLGLLFLAGEAMFGFVAVAALASLASLVVRYRRSGRVEREQTRWVLFAAAIAILLEAAVDVYGTASSGPTPAWVQTLGEGVGFALLAVAVAIAITRYKLYEIERIVSRTVTYAVVVLVLVGLYLGVVLGLAGLVSSDLGPVWVAGATLTVTVLAVPLTRRIRRLVDRRFNRSRFDTERIVTAFAGRLRARPDRGDVPAELIAVLARTVEPAHAAVWTVPTARTATTP